LLVDLVSFLHSDSPFFLAENYPKAITPSGVRVATFYALTGNLGGSGQHDRKQMLLS